MAEPWSRIVVFERRCRCCCWDLLLRMVGACAVCITLSSMRAFLMQGPFDTVSTLRRIVISPNTTTHCYFPQFRVSFAGSQAWCEHRQQTRVAPVDPLLR